MSKDYRNTEWLIDAINKYKNITDISVNTSIPKTTLSRNIEKHGLSHLLEKKAKIRKTDYKKYPYKDKKWLIEKLKEHGTPNKIVINENVSETSIRRYIEKFGLNYLIDNNKHKKSNSKEDIYLFKNKDWLLNAILEYKTVANIHKETGFSKTSLWRYIRKYELGSYIENCNPVRCRSLNEDYFETIDTEHKAYWLGLLMADGNVANYNNRYCIRLTLKEEDHYLIEKLKADINTDTNIYIDKYNRSTLRVWSKKMFNDLAKHGIVPNKTGKETIPETVPTHLLHHFIRGFFDGDGTIFKRKNRARHKGTIGFCCQNEQFIINLSKVFKDNCNFVLNYHPHKNNVYEIKTESFRKCSSIVKYMYNNATIAMLRKYDRVKQYYNINCPSLE